MSTSGTEDANANANDDPNADANADANANDDASADANANANDDASADADADADAQAIPVIARDTFSRTSTAALGMAETGGAWSTSGSATAFNVSNGVAKITVDDGSTRRAKLTGVSVDDADVQLAIASDKIGNGTAYLSVAGRVVGNDEYRCRLIVEGDASARATLTRSDADVTQTHLASSGALFNVSAGETIRMRCQVMGVSPTTLRMKLWRAASAEPVAWTLTASDSTPAFQAKGTVGVHMYMVDTTNPPIVVSLDDLLVRPASQMPN